MHSKTVEDMERQLQLWKLCSACLVEFDRDVLCVVDEVHVCREHFEAEPDSYRTDQQVRSGSLEPATTKPIIETGGGFIVFFVEGQVRVEPQILLQLLETFVRLSPRKQFLAYGAEQMYRVPSHQSRHLRRDRVSGRTVAPQEP